MDLQGKITCDHIVGDPVEGFTRALCPRCGGRGWYGGLDFNHSGQITTINGGSQLEQQITKAIVEEIRNSGYGFSQDILKSVIYDDTLYNIKKEIVRCMVYLKNTQVESKKNGFFYNPSEEISAISDVTVLQDSNDPRKVEVSLSVVAVSGDASKIIIPIGG